MGFVAAVRSGFRNYANFDGRACRAEYWWWALFALLTYVLSVLIDSAIGTTFGPAMVGQWALLGWVTIIVYLVILIPSLAVTIRRLHDADRSGAWWFVNFVPVIGELMFLYFLFVPGTPGPNQYGPPPGGQKAAYSRV